MVTRERCSFVRRGCSRIICRPIVFRLSFVNVRHQASRIRVCHERLTIFSPFRWHAFDTFDFHPQLVHERWFREWMTFDLWLPQRWHNLQLGWTVDTSSAAIFFSKRFHLAPLKKRGATKYELVMDGRILQSQISCELPTSSDSATGSTEILDSSHGENKGSRHNSDRPNHLSLHVLSYAYKVQAERAKFFHGFGMNLLMWVFSCLLSITTYSEFTLLLGVNKVNVSAFFSFFQAFAQ